MPAWWSKKEEDPEPETPAEFWGEQPQWEPPRYPSICHYDQYTASYHRSKYSGHSSGDNWRTPAPSYESMTYTDIPYIVPHSEGGYRPNFRLPRYGSVNMAPITKPTNWGEYLHGREWNDYVPYRGNARRVNFTSLKDERPKSPGLFRSLFLGCFGFGKRRYEYDEKYY